MTRKELELVRYIIDCAAVTLGNVFEGFELPAPDDSILYTFTESEKVDIARMHKQWQSGEDEFDGLPIDFNAYSLAHFMQFASWLLSTVSTVSPSSE